MKPKLSIICPAYNVEDYISVCIKSVLNQSFRDFEFIIINDGSTDHTEDIILEFKDSRIKYIKQKNAGPAAARNVGLNHAIGDYVGFIDSDDEIHIDRYKLAMEAAEKHNADIVQCNTINVYDNGTMIQRPNSINTERLILGGTPSYPGSLPVKIIRRSIIEKYNFRLDTNIKIGEDTCFMCLVYPFAKRIYCLSDILYYRHVRNNSLIHSSLDRDQQIQKLKLQIDGYNKVIKRLKNLKVDQKWINRPIRYRNTTTKKLNSMTNNINH